MTEQELNNYNNEMARQQIAIIRNSIPKFMLPGFNSIVSEHKDKIWFNEFINLYAGYIKDAVDQKVDPITPATALDLFKKKMKEDLKSFNAFMKDGLTLASNGVDDPDEAAQDEVYDEEALSEPATPEDLENFKNFCDNCKEELIEENTSTEDNISGELEAGDDTAEPEDEPIDII